MPYRPPTLGNYILFITDLLWCSSQILKYDRTWAHGANKVMVLLPLILNYIHHSSYWMRFHSVRCWAQFGPMNFTHISEFFDRFSPKADVVFWSGFRIYLLHLRSKKKPLFGIRIIRSIGAKFLTEHVANMCIKYIVGRTITIAIHVFLKSSAQKFGIQSRSCANIKTLYILFPEFEHRLHSHWKYHAVFPGIPWKHKGLSVIFVVRRKYWSSSFTIIFK